MGNILGSGHTQKVRVDSDPPNKGVAIDLSSDTDLDQPSFIHVGVGGDVKVDLAAGGTGLVYKNRPGGSFLEVLVTKVYSTANGTTATDLVANWTE